MVTAPIQATLARAAAALKRGHGGEAAQLLTQLQRSGSLSHEDELNVRCGLTEAWLLQDNLAQAGPPVRGIIITHLADERLRYAVKAVRDCALLLYEVEFHLQPA